VGLILDLAVVALALVVLVALATLAWTLAVSTVRAARAERERVADLRIRVADAERRLVDVGGGAAATLRELAERSARTGGNAVRGRRTTTPGDAPDA